MDRQTRSATQHNGAKPAGSVTKQVKLASPKKISGYVPPMVIFVSALIFPTLSSIHCYRDLRRNMISQAENIIVENNCLLDAAAPIPSGNQSLETGIPGYQKKSFKSAMRYLLTACSKQKEIKMVDQRSGRFEGKNKLWYKCEREQYVKRLQQQ
ncbi:uncharacterized protein LOC18030417 isoform X2 [Eutrema salsugineum]|uniref:uncharacterized protein LOC18030417 isoform X2 n=1 Tax=Eutrema salsugineum TaxID=72664 RepID=UPI000CECEF07|nr:uncharacterized protein LOC18030417 isoform X2 [Eutrema salsugineum]